MTKIASLGIVVGAVSAMLIGIAGTAQAVAEDPGRSRDSGIYRGDSNNPWRDQIVPRVKVPRVDTSVRTSP